MRRKRFWPYTVALFAMMGARAPSQVFVSPAGDDSSTGTSNRPVASLSKAIELSRSLPEGKPKRIVLQPGDFFDTGVTLGSADSGLILESESPGSARLIGGVTLSGWEKEGGPSWSAALPKGRNWDVRMFQINGRFCPRARFPEQGTFTHSSVFNVPWMSTTGGGWKRKPTEEELTTMEYKDGDIPAALDIHSVEITVFHMWDESVAGIKERDTANRKLKLSPPLGHPPGAFGVQKYVLWNLKQGMTRPGQWYFDRTRDRIVYWPIEGEDLPKAVAIVPTRQTIVQISGATNIVLRNLSIGVTTVPLIMGGFAAASFNGAIELHNANGVVLSGLSIAGVAGQAIKAMSADNAIRIADCSVSFCGAGGIYLSGAHNVISNSLIHGVGLMFPSAMAIHGDGTDCKLSHNEIYDTPYSAIGFGGKELLIENNRISDCMKVLHDGAAIYCFGVNHGVLRNNLAHDIVDTGGYGASAYYLDEQCRDCVVEKNISLNVARPSHNHMATNNVIRSNVFISKGDMRLTFPRCAGYHLEANVLYSGGNLTFEGINNVAVWSKNLVFCETGTVAGIELSDYSQTRTIPGLCGDTLLVDPRFQSTESLNLGYREQSPAFKLGLEALDASSAGRVINGNGQR